MKFGNTIVLDESRSIGGLFMCHDDCHGDQQVGFVRHGKNGDQRRWLITAIPSQALAEALGVVPWHCWLREAVVDDFGNLVITGEPQ